MPRLVQITDTHIYADPAARFDGMDTRRSLERVLARLRAGPAYDAIVMTGDLSMDGSTASYLWLQEAFAGETVPVTASWHTAQVRPLPPNDSRSNSSLPARARRPPAPFAWAETAATRASSTAHPAARTTSNDATENDRSMRGRGACTLKAKRSIVDFQADVAPARARASQARQPELPDALWCRDAGFAAATTRAAIFASSNFSQRSRLLELRRHTAQ